MSANQQSQKKKRKKWPWVVGIILILGVIIGVKIYTTLNNYDSLCLALQKGAFGEAEANSFSPRAEAKEEVRSDGVTVKTEVKFGDEFPNSYLDIYYPGDVNEQRPTFIYWHGGGHIFGDKNLGDPLSPDSDVSSHLYDYICYTDFHVIPTFQKRPAVTMGLGRKVGITFYSLRGEKPAVFKSRYNQVHFSIPAFLFFLYNVATGQPESTLRM